MAKYEIVRFIDSSDESETFAQFVDDRKRVAIYTKERYARENFGHEPFFDSVDEVREQGGEYADALEAALGGEVIAVMEV